MNEANERQERDGEGSDGHGPREEGPIHTRTHKESLSAADPHPWLPHALSLASFLSWRVCAFFDVSDTRHQCHLISVPRTRLHTPSFASPHSLFDACFLMPLPPQDIILSPHCCHTLIHSDHKEQGHPPGVLVGTTGGQGSSTPQIQSHEGPSR